MMYVRDVSMKSPRGSNVESRPIWVEPEPLPAGGPRLHADPLLHAILARRVADPVDAAEFLDTSKRPAPDPHLLPGMTEAVDRIGQALRRGEQIGLFGDYDTDGVTSTALLTHALRAASGGAQPVAVRLPLRQEGYGLSIAGVEELAADGANVLLAVDCGSRDHAAVARARELGLDVVILDHHRLVEPPPEGALVASAQLREDAPYRAVSAAGLAYLLATALAREGFDVGNGPGHDPEGLLDLAMIGLIGDVSSLTGVTRALVRDGLRQFREQTRPGLRALCEVAGTDPTKMTSEGIAFQVSPRLNAPGRLGNPQAAYELLITWDPRRAARLAEEAERANQKRKVLLDRVLREAEAMLESNPALRERRVLVVAAEGWEPGIVGLAASKLAERYDRPAVVLTVSNTTAHGSARSIPGFDVTSALSAAAGLLLRHGGHERAAGLALETAKMGELGDALEAAIQESATPLPGPPRLVIEADLEPERLRLDTARVLQAIGPFGEGNPVPLLRVSRLPIRGYTVMGRESQHLKVLTSGPGGLVDAILWSGAGRSSELIGARQVDIVGYLETNVWNGSQRVQMRLADFRRADR
ncbi:MAG: single-stranded-DNA-specific exonuclease RecJ [Thermomicrobiales bacterium]|jgi:single-stranded-DNA-specific exonuclease|nr:single-stranded-DNA-specific exonuclease RecJ [Thermomicrobiales bacterium]